MSRLKEVDLFEPIREFLLKESGCSEVYGEVLDCDVLGLHGSVDIIVELKTSLSFHLIDQAIDRLQLGHYVYIAIPKRKRTLPRSARTLLETHKIGLLEIQKEKWQDKLTASVVIPARYNRVATKRQRKGFSQIRRHIKPYNKTQVGGVKSGQAVTDYSIMIENIKDFLRYRKRGKWATVDEILEYCETHYANPKPSLLATLQAKWNENWCETKYENNKRYFKIRKNQDVVL